jgi:hypothetical protein
MEDEATDQRAEQKALDISSHPHQIYQAVAGASSQQTIGRAVPLASGISHCGASSTWQQKVLDVEAKLQNDLQQDLAR